MLNHVIIKAYLQIIRLHDFGGLGAVYLGFAWKSFKSKETK